MLLYFCYSGKTLPSLLRHTEVHSERKKIVLLKAIFFLNNHEIYPPAPAPPSLPHQGTPHSPTYFNKASVSPFFSKKKKIEKKEA